MFLALENFLVIKRYNMSDLYALFVGNLGDRIAGGGDFVVPWANVQQLSAKSIEAIQERLQAQGYAVAKVDGKAGMNTRALIGAYQKANGLKLDCWPTDALLNHVRAKGPEKGAPPAKAPTPARGETADVRRNRRPWGSCDRCGSRRLGGRAVRGPDRARRAGRIRRCAGLLRAALAGGAGPRHLAGAVRAGHCRTSCPTPMSSSWRCCSPSTASPSAPT